MISDEIANKYFKPGLCIWILYKKITFIATVSLKDTQEFLHHIFFIRQYAAAYALALKLRDIGIHMLLHSCLLASMVMSKLFLHHWLIMKSALLALCAGNSPVPGEFPTQKPVTRSFDVFFDLRLNKTDE